MEQARNYCQQKLKPKIKEAFRKHTPPANFIKEVGELGFIGCTYKEYDLPGVSSVAYGLIARELERVDTGVSTTFSVQNLSMFPIMEYGSKE